MSTQGYAGSSVDINAIKARIYEGLTEELASGHDTEVRTRAARVLGEHCQKGVLPETAVEALVVAAEDENLGLRRAAGCALGNAAKHTVLPDQAVAALIKHTVSGEAISNRVLWVWQDDEVASQWPPERLKLVFAVLTENLASRHSEEVHMTATRVLGYLGQELALPDRTRKALVKVARESWWCRAFQGAALQALKKSGFDGSGEKLRRNT